jgi:hypothetical protein
MSYLWLYITMREAFLMHDLKASQNVVGDLFDLHFLELGASVLG